MGVKEMAPRVDKNLIATIYFVLYFRAYEAPLLLPSYLTMKKRVAE